jgi:hypothetical protein
VDVRELFRAELARRGAAYTVTGDGRWAVGVGSLQLLVSLDNLDRQLTLDHQLAGDGADSERIAAFTSRLLAAARLSPVTASGLYWFTEPNDYEVAAEIRRPGQPAAGSGASGRQQ